MSERASKKKIHDGCVMKKNNLVEHKKGVPDSLNVRIFLCTHLLNAPKHTLTHAAIHAHAQ